MRLSLFLLGLTLLGSAVGAQAQSVTLGFSAVAVDSDDSTIITRRSGKKRIIPNENIKLENGKITLQPHSIKDGVFDTVASADILSKIGNRTYISKLSCESTVELSKEKAEKYLKMKPLNNLGLLDLVNELNVAKVGRKKSSAFDCRHDTNGVNEFGLNQFSIDFSFSPEAGQGPLTISALLGPIKLNAKAGRRRRVLEFTDIMDKAVLFDVTYADELVKENVATSSQE